MNDQIENHATIENADDRPLVTFALFAYNQEQYVREAVLGAFAQSYDPLEIILSDDCSTDRTFEIMQEMAAGYEGPHRVRVRKTESNRGTLLHVAEVAAIAQGVLLILAAGDDVSKESRSSVLVVAWKTTGAWGLCSRFDRIDATGRLLESEVASAVLESRGFKEFFYEDEGPVGIIHGCTSAYDIRVFQYLKLESDDFILAEDGAMSVLLNLLGKGIVNLNDSLILYRESPSSLTNSRSNSRLSFSRFILEERRIEWYTRSQANRCKLFLRMNEDLGLSKTRKMRVDAVRSELRLHMIRANWSTFSFMDRLRFIFNDKQPRWAIARLLGPKFFYLIKWLSSWFAWR